MPKNHLVVGINGNIGSALFAALRANNEQSYGTTQRQDAVADRIFYLNLLDDVNAWKIPDQKFDVVYICAGICRMNLCEEDPQKTRLVNIDGTQKLAQYFAGQGAFIVFLSTNQVFSGNIPHVAAGADYSPLNEYGRQKSEIESWLKQHIAKLAIVRLTKVVEPKMPLLMGWVEALRQNKTVEAFHDMALAPVMLADVVKVLIRVGQNAVPGCYQVSGQEDVSYFELAKMLAKKISCQESQVLSVSALDKGLSPSFLPRFTSLSCSSTMARCDFSPPSIQDVIDSCIETRNLSKVD